MHVNFNNNYLNEELGRDVDATKKSREKTGVVTDWGRQKDRNNIISNYQLLDFFSFNLTECNLGCFFWLLLMYLSLIFLEPHVKVDVQRGIANKNGKKIVVKERLAQKRGK